MMRFVPWKGHRGGRQRMDGGGDKVSVRKLLEKHTQREPALEQRW